MTVYRDEAHGVVRAMTVDAISLHSKQTWQNRYQAGYEEGRAANPCPLDRFDQLTQDSMARALLHRELEPVLWHVLAAKYSLHAAEVDEAIRYLIPRVKSNAHRLFVTKAVFAWAIPAERRRVPESFYVLHSWDNNQGTPERTLRRWRVEVHKWLNAELNAGHLRGGELLAQAGMIVDQAA